MFSLPSLRKLTLVVAAAAVAAPLALSTTASARVIRHYGPVRVYHGPRFYPRGRFYPGRRVFYVRPRFYAPAYRCYATRKWVSGPFGWHWATGRKCY